MSRGLKVAFWVAGAFVALGILVALLGPEYEMSRLPATEQQRLSDSDWFGVPWLIRGVGIAGIGLLIALGACLALIDQGWRSKAGPAT
jgi:hypothetical protein